MASDLRQHVAFRPRAAVLVTARKRSSNAADRPSELTDDFDPLERMQIHEAERWRALFVERIAPALLLR